MFSILAINTMPAHGALGDATLQYTMDNEDVKVLQRELQEFGYLNLDGGFTSYYGNSTLEAVKAFQSYRGLEVTGIYEENTHLSLSSLKQERLAKYKLVHNKDLTLEDENADVLALQEALKKLKFLDIEVCTNYFGPITESAIISFQRAVGINADGIAGARTIQMINKALVGEDVFIEGVNRSASRSSLGQTIVDTGKKYLGTPYRSGQASPGGFDCSGYTSYVYKQSGVNISRSSNTQANDGTWVAKSDLQVGDLIIFAGTYRKGPSHTGIYIGNGQFIHSSSYGGGVKIDNLNSSYYSGHYHSARRLY